MNEARSGLTFPSINSNIKGKNMTLTVNINKVIKRGFSLIKNLKALNVPNFTV